MADTPSKRRRKGVLQRIERLNLERKYDLGMIESSQPRAFQYNLENDVPMGAAWHYNAPVFFSGMSTSSDEPIYRNECFFTLE